MARQVESVGGVLLGHSWLVEKPVIEVGTVAVKEDDRITSNVTQLQVAELTATNFDELGFRSLGGRRSRLGLRELGLEVADKGVNFIVRNRVVGYHPKQRANRDRFTGVHELATQL